MCEAIVLSNGTEVQGCQLKGHEPAIKHMRESTR